MVTVPGVDTPPGLGSNWWAEQQALRAVRRGELIGIAARSPGWRLEESEHYFMLTNIDDPGFVAEAKRRLELLRGLLVWKFPSETPLGCVNLPSPGTARICAKGRQYQEYGGPTGSSSYYWSLTGEFVTFDDAMGAGREKTTWPGLQRGAVYEYFDSTLGLDDAPQWLLSGVAEYYAAMRLAGEHLELPAYDFRIKRVKSRLTANELLPLRDLMAFSRSEFLGRNDRGMSHGANSDQAWSVVLFLMSGGYGCAAWDPSWDLFLARQIEALQGAGSPEDALAAALAGVDLDVVEAVWRDWIGRYPRGS